MQLHSSDGSERSATLSLANWQNAQNGAIVMFSHDSSGSTSCSISCFSFSWPWQVCGESINEELLWED